MRRMGRGHLQPTRQLPGVKGRVRWPTKSRLDEEIVWMLDEAAVEFGCSRSFVIHTLLADALGYRVEYRYDRPPQLVRKVRRR